MMKKLIITFLMLFIAVFIFSTGQGESQEKKPVTVTIVTIAYVGENVLPRPVAVFREKYPYINLKVESYPFAQMFEVIETKMSASATDIDVLYVDVPVVANYTVKGYLEPLDAYFTEEDKNQFIDSALEASTINGKFMAPPINSSSVGLYCNTDIFRENGIEPPSIEPEQRWTWSKVVEVAKRLTIDSDNDGQIDIWGFSIDQFNRFYQMQPFAASLGGKAVSSDGLKVSGYINAEPWVKAAQFYQDLFHIFKVAPLGVSDFQSPELFKAGKVAMLLTGPWHANAFNQVEGLNWIYAPHPYFAEGKPVTPTGSWHIGISKNSQHKKEAAEVVRFLTLEEGNLIYFEVGGNLPANKKVLDYAEKLAKEKGDTIMAICTHEARNTAVPRPLTPGYLELEMMMYQTFEDIRNGAEPKKALDQVAVKIDSALKKYSR